MIIAYEGTRYAGFQRQAAPIVTIQGTLEQALYTLTGAATTITGAGRTDAGVHARGQVVNFYSATRLPVGRIQLALNSILPEDIVILDVAETDPDFHARYGAKSKTYSYAIHNDILKPVFHRNFVYHYKRSLDFSLMQAAAVFLEGTHDFRAFQASGSAIVNTIRTIHFVKLCQTGPGIMIQINADGFLYHMVRNIVGTLVAVGNSQITIGTFLEILKKCNRIYAGPTAPACGLCLEEVNYENDGVWGNEEGHNRLCP